MAILKFIAAGSFKGTIKYVTRDAKLRDDQQPAAAITGINCSSEPQQAIRDWQMTKLAYKKTDGRSAIHIVQSFPATEKVTAEEVHEIGIEYVEKCSKFDGFEVLIATHTDQQNGNLHNHIVLNSVNAETGKKWHLDPEELRELKEINNQICLEHGLSVPVKGQTINKKVRDNPVANNRKAYAILKAADQEKIESYIQDIGEKVIEVIKTATSREDFIEKLKAQGVGVTWSDNRKYITFEDLKRKKERAKKYKVRNKKLGQYYNLNLEKEQLENGFEKQIRKLSATARGRNELNNGLNNGLGAVQSGQQPVTATVTGQGLGKQQLKAGVSTSLQADTELEQLRFGAAESGAAQSERKRAERDNQAEADRIANAEKLARAERKRAEQERAATPKTATKSKSKGYSIGD